MPRLRKEALVVTWASERFQDYLIDLHYTIKTDHKSLVPLLSSKNLEELLMQLYDCPHTRETPLYR